MTQPGIRLEASRGDLFGESRTQKYKTGFIHNTERSHLRPVRACSGAPKKSPQLYRSEAGQRVLRR